MSPKTKIIKLYSILLVFTAIMFLLAVLISSHHILSFGLCFLAFGFGARHGIDVDHITAIDNVTRKLINSDSPPIAVGFFFSLGHSLVVVLLTLFVVLMTNTTLKLFPVLTKFGQFFGGFFAGIFLLLFALINGHLFFNTLRKYSTKEHSGQSASPHGMLSMIFKPVLRVVNKSWHMLPVGFLFGLGFDTATEVAILGMSGREVVHHTSLWVIMIFPLLFACGMCLVDTASGLLMARASRWANINPQRHLYYNLTITGLSFLTALIIGTYEILNLLATKFNWEVLSSCFMVVNNHFTLLGVLLIVLVLLTWSMRTLLIQKRQ